jgi:transposase
LVIDSGRSLRDVGVELGVNYETLREWVVAERRREEADRVERGEPLSFNERFELEQLRRRNAQLEKDVEFLKKQRPSSPRATASSRVSAGGGGAGRSCVCVERAADA